LGFFVFASRVVGGTTLGRSVACRTFQRYRIGLELNPFLLRGSDEKWQEEMLKMEALKIALLKIAV